MHFRGPRTTVIDLGGRRAVPGLTDTHTHLIRGGLSFNLELRWDGVPSLADALRMLREQARRTPPPQWVRVVGGWSEFQFAERRMPTLEEINAAAPDTPVFVLHLYDRALLNRAALRAVGYTRDTPEPPGGTIERDKRGEPTGMLVARPNATILYKTLGLGPKLDPEDKEVSTRQFMRELNRLGVTGVIDAGGGSQVYPDDYRAVEALHRRGEMTVRIAYNLFTQSPGGELEDFRRWAGMTRPGGRRLVLPDERGRRDAHLLGGRLRGLPRAPARPARRPWNGTCPPSCGCWPRSDGRSACTPPMTSRSAGSSTSSRRSTATCRSTDLHWFFDHAETVTDRNLERIKALGGGIAIQHRMAYQGEYFVDRYGAAAAERTPPIARMLEMDIPVAAGTDATRVASYNPWVCLHWLVTGRTVGGLVAVPGGQPARSGAGAAAVDPGRRVVLERRRESAGHLKAGQLADLAVLTEDYFAVPEDRIPAIESVLDAGGREGRLRRGPLRRALASAAADPPGLVAGGRLRRLPPRRRRARRRPASGGRWPARGSGRLPSPARRMPGRRGAVMGRGLRMLGVLRVAVSNSSGEVVMRIRSKALFGPAIVATLCGLVLADDPQAAKETSLAGPGGVKLTVRMQGPYDADVPLQVVCYFKHKEAGDTTLGAAVELDKKLGGVIASLRNRGEFAGDELETLLLTPPEGTIKPKALLLIGLGDEESLSLDRMERVGRVALREAARLGVERVAFAPLIRDQGNSKFGTGDVAHAVVRGMLLALDTESRLQKEGLAKDPLDRGVGCARRGRSTSMRRCPPCRRPPRKPTRSSPHGPGCPIGAGNK